MITFLRFCILTTSSLCFSALCAQTFQISGQVVDADSGTPVEFATVLFTSTKSGETLTGVTTDVDGRFGVSLKEPVFTATISFIGFEKLILEAPKPAKGRIDFGTVQLGVQGTLLDEVVVRAEESQTVFKLDKRVFNVGKDLSSTGASALEVLNNVPSVAVDIEGQISLRGSTGVQILINGKPSVLADGQNNALGTLTAEMIDRIEVVTNPSAKYDAEGTSGIINIVIKKDERRGVNGAISLNTGIPDAHSIGLSLNRRTEKFNLFSQLGVGHRSSPTNIRTINEDRVSNTSIRSEGKEFRNETYYNLVLGSDYYINDLNVITVSGNFVYELEKQPSNTDFEFFDGANTLTSKWQREEETTATNPKSQYEVQYKKGFVDSEDHSLLISAQGSYFGKDLTSDFVNTTIEGTNRDAVQKTRSNFKEAENTFKIDYAKPLQQGYSIETGAQYILNDVSNDFAVSNLEGDEFILDKGLTNIFEWNQKVLAAYGTGAREFGNWGVKLGVRGEYTQVETVLVDSNQVNKQDYANLFPSGHISYKLNEKISFQAGYSRRVSRPRLWDLNPFFNIRNNFAYRVGNPDLQPEFSDAYELTSIFILGKLSFNAGAYYRFTSEVVERVAFSEDNITITRPENIGTNKATGLEFNGKYRANSKLTFNSDLNYFTFIREGDFNDQNFDFSGNQWSGRLVSKIKLPADFEVEFTGNYRSGYRTVQGEVFDQAFADFGLRKKLFGGKGAVNVSVRDIFESRIRESEQVQPDFYFYNRAYRGRFVTLGVSYGFGKGETMQYGGQRRY